MAEQLRVSAKTNPNSLAGAITGVIRKGEKEVDVVVVGAASLNQLTKAVAIARGYVAPSGINLAMVPSFTEVEISDKERTALNISVIVVQN